MNKNELALNKLKSIVGAELYERICDEMAGTKFYIPAIRGGFASLSERNKAIREDMWNSVPIVDVIEKYGVSASTVYRIFESKG